GPSMSPFNAWVFQKGLETLPLRMNAHCEHAAELADWLQGHPAVRKVFYPGLSTHPGHLLALQQQRGFGGIVAFEIHGSQADAWQMIDQTRLLSITANLGDAKSTITHPASTTHARISEKQRQAAGITENLIRIGVGLEHPDDVKADLRRGLDLIATSQSRLAG
ncbi:MAG: PLP-dependent transferase, partial [Arenicellales bacterium]